MNNEQFEDIFQAGVKHSKEDAIQAYKEALGYNFDEEYKKSGWPKQWDQLTSEQQEDYIIKFALNLRYMYRRIHLPECAWNAIRDMYEEQEDEKKC